VKCELQNSSRDAGACTYRPDDRILGQSGFGNVSIDQYFSANKSGFDNVFRTIFKGYQFPIYAVAYNKCIIKDFKMTIRRMYELCDGRSS
jgi:hypothetical protein